MKHILASLAVVAAAILVLAGCSGYPDVCSQGGRAHEGRGSRGPAHGAGGSTSQGCGGDQACRKCIQ